MKPRNLKIYFIILKYHTNNSNNSNNYEIIFKFLNYFSIFKTKILYINFELRKEQNIL